MNIQRDNFQQRGGESTAKPQYALPVIDQKAAKFTNAAFVAGTDFTIPAGAAGASVKIQLPQRPILGNFGRTGSFGNTTLVLTGAIATTLTTEVAFIADTNNQGGDVTSLTNGQFMVDYETATIYGKRVDTSTTGTATYSYLAGGSSDITSITPGTGATNLGKAEDAAHTSGDTGVMSLGVRKDTAVALAADSDYQPPIFNSTGHQWVAEGFAPNYEDQTNGVAATAQKPLAVATYDWSKFKNLGANATLNVKASTGNVFSLYCHNINAAARYIQLHDTATVPAGAAVPIYTFLVPAGGTVLIDGMFFGQNGANFPTGIAFAFSTTEATYTAGTATDQFTIIQYK